MPGAVTLSCCVHTWVLFAGEGSDRQALVLFPFAGWIHRFWACSCHAKKRKACLLSRKKKKIYITVLIKDGIYVTLLLSQTYSNIMSKVGSQECGSLRGSALKAAFVEIRLRTECI